MSKNIHGKTRDIEKPYAVFVMGDWEWRVLKRYQTPENETKNPYAVWFCAVQSPNTFGSWDYGDTYISDIPGAVAGQDFGADESTIAVSVAG